MALPVPSADTAALLMALGQALACGILIGTERGWAGREGAPGSRFAGIRTFTLFGLLGALAIVTPRWIGVSLAAAGAALVVVGYLRNLLTGGSPSATSAIAALGTIALGALAAGGRGVVALAAAAVVTLVLAARGTLHDWVQGLGRRELMAIARFGVIALVVTPLLPSRDMGPYGALNPRSLWLVVVLVSGLSFAGYLLSKRLGPSRGLLLTAACGAIVSSTAVTAAYARRLGPDAPNPQLIGGIAIASAVMFARVLVLIAILSPSAIGPIALAVTPALLVTAPFVSRALRSGQGEAPAPLTLGNPLELKPALLLAAFVAALAIASRWMLDRFGGAGVGVLLALTGMADVDAAVITFSRLPPGSLAPGSAAAVLVIPVLLNTAFKAGIALVFGARPFGVRAALPLLLAVGAGAASIALTLIL